jgi:MFS family permease
LYLLAFVDEFGPVYAVYTLWFNDNGISTSQVSTVFLVWAATALSLEIPSGALADRVDRRRLLAAAFTIRAGGIALWLIWPTFTGVLIGAVMWAAHDALASGTWEAMIHDELTAVDQAHDYQPVMARIGQCSHLGIAAGTMLGAALLRLDVGLEALGWLTVAPHIGSVVLVATLPDVGWVTEGDDREHREAAAIGAGPVAGPILDDVAHPQERAGRTDRGWWGVLRAGLRDARDSALIARLVMVGALLEGLFILDEYIPLLVRARGGADAVAPIVVFVVWAGLLAGGEIAARRPDLGGRPIGAILVAGVIVMTVAFVTDSAWALMLISVGYAALQLAWVATDARLQERTPADTRATVTSVRGFGAASVSMVAFVVIGAMSDGDDPTPGHYVVLVALGIAGALVVRWLPGRAEMAR